MFEHYSVLNEETTSGVLNDLTGVYVDGTLGGAGHTLTLLNKLDGGMVISFDQDITAINNSEKLLKNYNSKLIHSNFKNLKDELNKIGINEIDGLILDLGFSSPQIDNPERGFSYMQDGPLDMRMDLSSDFKAYDIVNTYEKKDLLHILNKYGEEKYSNFIVNKIIEKRQENKIKTTFELVDVIEEAIPQKFKSKIKGHVAKKTFQALRIEVNDELKVLDKVIDDAFDMLKSGGRMAIISFHSLEDKIVKHKFRKFSEVNDELKGLPVIPEEFKAKGKVVTNKPILPTKKEIEENSRSKSAKLRVMEKL